MTPEQSKDIYKEFTAIREDLTEIKVDIAKLTVKSGLWGAIGSALVVLPTVIVYLVTK